MDDSGDRLLDLAHRLADAADRVTLAHFRSEQLLATTKDDGTPVSAVDLMAEQSMRAIVLAERPDDAFLGEEVGATDGTSGLRWIVDGIDGTHNFAAGWPGWGTIVGLEIDGQMAVGLVTAPKLGRRWWAVRDEGAWVSVDAASPTAIRCGSTVELAAATVTVIPYVGHILGWRDQVARRFPLPPAPRSQCFALDATMVASGELDVAIFTFGGVWDFAATSLIVTEAGGVFRDAWGGNRLDTASAVFANPALSSQVLDVLASLRPETPDRPRLAKTTSTPIGTAEEQHADAWRAFGVRHGSSMSARVHVDNAPPFIMAIVDERAAELDRPFAGVTTDGHVRARTAPTASTAMRAQSHTIAEAAAAFLDVLTPSQQHQATFPMDATEWRTWINVHMNHFRHGLILEDLDQRGRDLGLELVRATLSARGYDQARSIMRLNQLLADLTGDHEAFGEWPYFVSIFGTPGSDEPWGWQIDGHHLCVNAVLVDGLLTMTPTFMGAEPRSVHSGPYAGISLFDPEEALGLDLIRSFDARQRERATIYASLHPDEIPMHLQNPFDGRMQAGAFHDNLVAAYQGVSGADMTDAQRRLLTALAGTYVGWQSEQHSPVKMREVESHLDETWFSWYGGIADDSPFYYRVHSPVVLIEFDHHPGVAFDNEVPSRHHVHTVVRTPNGGDYGADLLRVHHEQFAH